MCVQDEGEFFVLAHAGHGVFVGGKDFGMMVSQDILAACDLILPCGLIVPHGGKGSAVFRHMHLNGEDFLLHSFVLGEGFQLFFVSGGGFPCGFHHKSACSGCFRVVSGVFRKIILCHFCHRPFLSIIILI